MLSGKRKASPVETEELRNTKVADELIKDRRPLTEDQLKSNCQFAKDALMDSVSSLRKSTAYIHSGRSSDTKEQSDMLGEGGELNRQFMSKDWVSKFRRLFQDKTPAQRVKQWQRVASSVRTYKISADLTMDENDQMLKTMYMLLCIGYETDEDRMKRAGVIFPLGPQFETYQKTMAAQFAFLQRNLLASDMLNPDTSTGRQRCKMLNHMSQMFYGMQKLSCALQFTRYVGDSAIQTVQNVDSTYMLGPLRPNPTDKRMILLKFYYDKAFQLSLRRDGDGLFREKVTDEGQRTFAYVPYMKIEEFVFGALYPASQHQYWISLLISSGMAKAMIDTLTKLYTEELPKLVTDQNVRSFRNGLYYTEYNDPESERKREIFLTYEPRTPEERKKGYRDITDLETAPQAYAYFDMDFREDLMRAEKIQGAIARRAANLSPNMKYTYFDVNLGPFRKILRSQNLVGETASLLCCMIGRSLRRQDVHDHWQKLPILYGLPGTGKSVLLALIAKLFPLHKVGILGNQPEKNFPLMGLDDKDVVFMLDISKDFGLNQQDMLQMITCERVAVNVKNKGKITLKWDKAMWMAANELPYSTSASQGWSRRIMVFFMRYFVHEKDLELPAKLEAMIDKLLYVFNCSYMDWLNKIGPKRDIKEFIPPDMREQEERLLTETNPVLTFLNEAYDISQVEEKEFNDRGDKEIPFIYLRDFQRDFRFWLKDNLIKAKPPKKTEIETIFKKRGIFMNTSNNQIRAWGVSRKENSAE